MVLLNLLTLQRFETGSSCGLNNREVRARWERDLFQGREISLTGHKPEIDLWESWASELFISVRYWLIPTVFVLSKSLQ